MQRTNVYEESGRTAGWFDYHALLGKWSDRDPVTGNGSGGAGRGHAVLLTKSGRWVLEAWTAWSGDTPTHWYISPDEAREWLLRHGEDEAVEEHFGKPPAEARIGRPQVGDHRRTITAPMDLWEQVDAAAGEEGVTAPEVVRRALREHLAA